MQRLLCGVAALGGVAAAKWPSHSKFDCPFIQVPPEPTDISQLHPAHISIAMAVGDSITAAFSARSDVFEARDISYSIGKGYKDQLTLPWLISQYSGKVDGTSNQAELPVDLKNLATEDYHPRTDHLNVAMSQAAAHVGSLEVEWAHLLSNFPKYENFENRWKVLTIWLFANDVSHECKQPVEKDGLAELWEDRLHQFLVNATSTLTKTYINLMSMLDLSSIHRIQQSTEYCTFVHEKLIDEGGCVDRGNATELELLDRNIHYMNHRLHAMAAEWRVRLQQQNRTDLAIVVQPFLEGVGSVLDKSFVSKLDCFHPSAKAHESLAINLWNSMLCTSDRAHQCGRPFSVDMLPVCPTESSVFYAGPDVIPSPSTSSLSVVV